MCKNLFNMVEGHIYTLTHHIGMNYVRILFEYVIMSNVKFIYLCKKGKGRVDEIAQTIGF